MCRLVGLIAGLLTALVLSACAPSNGTATSIAHKGPTTNARVGTVDGLEVVVGEVEREFRRSRGSGSATEATTQAFQRVVAVKVQQAMMLREGVIADAGYGTYLSGLTKENARREAALRKGEAVYGPTSLEPDYYFGYRFDIEVTALKERLAAGELRVDEADLRTYYESVKARLFNKGTKTTADILTIPHPVTDAEQRAGEVERRLRAGENAEAIARSLDIAARRDTITVETATTRIGSQADPISAACEALQPGEVSRVLDTGEAFVVVRSVAKQSLGFTTFEHNEERIRSLRLDQKYRELIQSQVRQAEIDIDQDVLGRIPLQ